MRRFERCARGRMPACGARASHALAKETTESVGMGSICLK